MSQTYTNGFNFDAVGGEATCVELPAPPRGFVRRLVVKQVDGVLSGFSFNLLDRNDACAGVAAVSSSFEGDTPETANVLLDVEMHRILAPVTVAPAADISAQYDLDAGYENRDEQDIRRTPNSRIYLDITVGGSGSKGFQIAYTLEPITL